MPVLAPVLLVAEERGRNACRASEPCEAAWAAPTPSRWCSDTGVASRGRVGTALEENVDEFGLLLDEFLHGGERAARGELPMSTPSLRIAGRRIAADEPPYVVAEMSANHGGSFARAVDILEAAAAAGADAVKLQTYTADTITLDHDGPGFVLTDGPWAGRRLWDLYDEAHTPWAWHAELFARARELGIACFSSPFDPRAVELLESLDAPAYKIASFELVDLPLVRLVASTGKPVILSTGMAAPHEIRAAVEAARAAGCDQLAVLHAVSGYPTPVEQANLRAIPRLAEEHDAVIGLSDHTLGTVVASTAVALGARVIEKHVVRDRRDGGPDAAFSLEPHELAQLVSDSHSAFTALGDGSTERPASERSQAGLRRSLHVVADVLAGQPLTTEHVRSIRPGGGLPPDAISRVLGAAAARDLTRGTPLTWDDVVPVGFHEQRS